MHRLWQALPARQRRLWLARGTAWVAPRPDPLPLPACGGVVVGGEIGRASGLGEAARIMDQALQRLGVPHSAIDTARRRPDARAAGWPDRAALVLHVNAPQLPATLIGLGRGRLSGRRIIGNWYWELPVVPTSWHPALAHVHEIWAPSRFTAMAFEALAPGRVRVVPPALALAPPVPSPLDRQAFGLPADVVVVLTSFSLASSFARKNPIAAIGAFRKAFGDRRDRLLLLKVGNSEHHGNDLLLLQEAIAGAPNIRLETRMLPEADMHALTRACDIVLSLHRSEGFGLVPAQAMLLGRPVVSTDWSATTEFLDESCGVPIGYRLVPAADPRGVFEAPGAVWADADIDQAAQALRALADAPGRRIALGQAAEAAARARLGGAGLLAALAAIGVPVPDPVARA
ncbi:glycosyltransferase [Lichenicola sp.]|uniref:glycosyltransferase n=1 Tax=Lichenicola sp. TaxID=2804529 RepID=UPI003B008839